MKERKKLNNLMVLQKSIFIFATTNYLFNKSNN